MQICTEGWESAMLWFSTIGCMVLQGEHRRVGLSRSTPCVPSLTERYSKQCNYSITSTWLRELGFRKATSTEFKALHISSTASAQRQKGRTKPRSLTSVRTKSAPESRISRSAYTARRRCWRRRRRRSRRTRMRRNSYPGLLVSSLQVPGFLPGA